MATDDDCAIQTLPLLKVGKVPRTLVAQTTTETYEKLFTDATDLLLGVSRFSEV